MTHYSKRVSKNLRKMIVAKGISAEKLAFGAGVSKSTISNYLSNKRMPTIPVLERIAEYLKLDFLEFFKP